MQMKWFGTLGLIVATSMACGDDTSTDLQNTDGGTFETDAQTPDENDEKDASAAVSDSGSMGMEADAGTEEDSGRDGGGTEEPGELSEAQPACAAKDHEFADPAAPEFMQWFEMFELTVKPAAPSDYLMSEQLRIGLLHLGAAEIVTITLGGAALAPIGATIPAGTYTCAANQVGINSSALGVSQQNVPDSACSVTFTDDVVQGGRIEGSFWSYIPANPAVNFAGGCVVGRFGLTDVAE